MMPRKLIAQVVFVAACGLASSCGMGGYLSPGAFDLPNGGLGPFRLLDPTESESGQAILVNGIVDSAMAVRDGDGQVVLFYTSALIGERLAEVPGSPWLSRFFPRKIRRSEPTARPTFVGEIDVLAASEGWEGAEVFDPWMITLADGTMRLYYAAEGGIGVAEASSATGTFVRIGTEPVLSTARVAFDDGAPRHPSVIFDGDRYVLYFATETKLGVAFSEDGLGFTGVREVALELSSPAEDDPAIATFGTPSILWKTPSVGEPFAHVFVEARIADGTRRLAVAGTRDHETFETALIPPIGRGENLGAPAAIQWDDRTTMLYFTTDRTVSGGAGRGLYASVSPGTERFTKPTTEGL